jgi:hypothetical protein
MKPGATFDFHTHWHTCYLPVALVYNEAVCSDPTCGLKHGWMLELGILWWSLTFEVLVDPDAL